MANYYVALAEVDEILKHLEKNFISKIPEETLELIRNNKEKI